MARKERPQQKNLKPGSSSEDAKKVGGKGDFGVPEEDTVDRNYVSENTKQSDPGNARPRAGEESLEVGVGKSVGGAGNASGGDLDPDIVGVGGIGGLSQSGPDNFPNGRPDESDGTSRTFASGGPAKGEEGPPQVLGGGTGRAGTVVDEFGDVSTGRDGQGAAAATNPPARGDDSFAAEVSLDEASGQDNTRSDREG
jgi:hypothetical protein